MCKSLAISRKAFCMMSVAVCGGLVAIASASEPAQTQATTAEDFFRATQAVQVGVSPDAALLEHQEAAIRDTAHFYFDFWDRMFRSPYVQTTSGLFLTVPPGAPVVEKGQILDGFAHGPQPFVVTVLDVDVEDVAAMDDPVLAVLLAASGVSKFGIAIVEFSTSFDTDEIDAIVIQRLDSSGATVVELQPIRWVTDAELDALLEIEQEVPNSGGGVSPPVPFPFDPYVVCVDRAEGQFRLDRAAAERKHETCRNTSFSG